MLEQQYHHQCQPPSINAVIIDLKPFGFTDLPELAIITGKVGIVVFRCNSGAWPPVPPKSTPVFNCNLVYPWILAAWFTTISRIKYVYGVSPWRGKLAALGHGMVRFLFCGHKTLAMLEFIFDSLHWNYIIWHQGILSHVDIVQNKSPTSCTIPLVTVMVFC